MRALPSAIGAKLKLRGMGASARLGVPLSKVLPSLWAFARFTEGDCVVESKWEPDPLVSRRGGARPRPQTLSGVPGSLNACTLTILSDSYSADRADNLLGFAPSVSGDHEVVVRLDALGMAVEESNKCVHPFAVKRSLYLNAR